jgi:hypothetical protein
MLFCFTISKNNWEAGGHQQGHFGGYRLSGCGSD